jgi:hypothetical protein
VSALDPAYEYTQGYVLTWLPVPPGLPAKISLGGNTYVAKPRIHCSLVAVKNLIAKIAQRDKISSDEAEKIVTDAVFTALNAVKPK